MKKIIVGISIYLLTTAAVFAAKPVSVFYVQTANHATLQALDKKHQRYIIKLQNPHRVIAYVSDRPNRITGQLSSNMFSKKWTGKGSFKKDSPNAVLIGTDSHTPNSSRLFELTVNLSKPIIDKDNHVVGYYVDVLGRGVALPASVNLDNPYLVIDDACLTCIG